MADVKGRVIAGSRAISGALIEAFHSQDNFQKYIPIEKRTLLGEYSLKRLGSAITDSAGEFLIQYEPGKNKTKGDDKYANINLWLIASACCNSEEDLKIIFQAGDVRMNAGEVEQYIICLSENYSDVNNPKTEQTGSPTPETIKTRFKTKTELQQAQLEVAQEKFTKRVEIRSKFKSSIAPEIRKQLSLVELDDDGEPLDPEFVKAEEPVRKKAEFRMLSAMADNLDTALDDEEKLTLKGRISLTEAQLTALEEAAITSDDETLTVGEDELSTILKSEDGEGENPENGSQIVNRVNVIEQFCRDRTKGEGCLSEVDEPTGEEDDDAGEGDIEVDIIAGNGDVPVESRQPTDLEDRLGENVTLESLKEEMPRYIASVLDEVSVLDGVLPSPGTQLDEETISASSSFPSLTLPPGPADVAAFHDFYDLQIAFKPVWQEALDESLIGDAEAIFEHYVENGGDPDQYFDIVFQPLILTGQVFLSPPDVLVQRHIDITNEEWNALNRQQQDSLSEIATEIEDKFILLDKDKLQGNVFTDGLTESDLQTFNNTRQYVLEKVNDLREQGERFVRVARTELERQAAGKSIVPNNDILNQLKQRANSSYPAKYFAANKRQRSVNFGILLTYRQRWTPTAYQVGELIKSLPLAPKEIRKYSKKIVRKERRARKEIESNLESLKSETNSTTRAEAEIVQKAMDKTNFNASANGSFTVGVWSGGGSSALTQDTENQSAETKKSFHEAVVKAAREYKNELKVELETEDTFETEFQESGEIMNPNDELTVTYLFYELQRRYRVEERLHRLTSVVLVAQEMPNPGEIDEDWLTAHRWILNRVLLDDSFKQPLQYVAEGMVAEQFALEELRKTMAQQRRLVEELKEDVADSRVLTESRYAALQRSMERTARATQRKKKSGGLLGFAKKLTTPLIVGDLVDRFIGVGGDEEPEAARVREAAAQDAYQRELQRLRDLEGQLAQTNASLAKVTEEFTDRLGEHLSNVVQVTELKNHVKDNITHYMQAIWMHEPFQQRWLRLKDVPVPVLKRENRNYVIERTAIRDSLANVAHFNTAVHDFTTFPEIVLPEDGIEGELDTVPLYEVADIDDLIGFRANYMIFPLRKANAITDFMMEPYVEKAASGFGLTDPDDLGNMSLDEFSDYVCCLKEHLSEEEFDNLKETLKAQLKKLLQSPLRDDEEIVVPMDAMYIEALPGATPILEDFKLLHRQIDAADAQEDLRLKKMEKLRYAQRLLEDELDDPETEAKYVFEGAPGVSVGTSSPSSGISTGGS